MFWVSNYVAKALKTRQNFLRIVELCGDVKERASKLFRRELVSIIIASLFFSLGHTNVYISLFGYLFIFVFVLVFLPIYLISVCAGTWEIVITINLFCSSQFTHYISLLFHPRFRN